MLTHRGKLKSVGLRDVDEEAREGGQIKTVTPMVACRGEDLQLWWDSHPSTQHLHLEAPTQLFKMGPFGPFTPHLPGRSQSTSCWNIRGGAAFPTSVHWIGAQNGDQETWVLFPALPLSPSVILAKSAQLPTPQLRHLWCRDQACPLAKCFVQCIPSRYGNRNRHPRPWVQLEHSSWELWAPEDAWDRIWSHIFKMQLY